MMFLEGAVADKCPWSQSGVHEHVGCNGQEGQGRDETRQGKHPLGGLEGGSWLPRRPSCGSGWPHLALWHVWPHRRGSRGSGGLLGPPCHSTWVEAASPCLFVALPPLSVGQGGSLGPGPASLWVVGVVGGAPHHGACQASHRRGQQGLQWPRNPSLGPGGGWDGCSRVEGGRGDAAVVAAHHAVASWGGAPLPLRLPCFHLVL